jgi:hypothetical protein
MRPSIPAKRKRRLGSTAPLIALSFENSAAFFNSPRDSGTVSGASPGSYVIRPQSIAFNRKCQAWQLNWRLTLSDPLISFAAALLPQESDQVPAFLCPWNTEAHVVVRIHQIWIAEPLLKC